MRGRHLRRHDGPLALADVANRLHLLNHARSELTCDQSYAGPIACAAFCLGIRVLRSGPAAFVADDIAVNGQLRHLSAIQVFQRDLQGVHDVFAFLRTSLSATCYRVVIAVIAVIATRS